jgi:undecaprenyl-diphosphatase
VPVAVRFVSGAIAHDATVDASIGHWLNALLRSHDGIEDPLRGYVLASEALFAVVVVGLLVAGALRRRAGWLAAGAAAGGAAAIALAIGKIVSDVVQRPRPFVSRPHAMHALIAHAADPGFPSDHSLAAFAIATTLVLRLRPIGLAALVGAALLAVGRVGLGVHWPSDVLAGAGIGAAVALALHGPAVRNWLDRRAEVLVAR